MAVHITGSVGEKGINRRPDVWNVQVLLTKVRTARGEAAIKLDGFIGPQTNGAIKRFQTQQFGWSNPDGRVDPHGNTLKHLNLLTAGPTKFLLEPVTTHRRGRWEVKIGADGEIVVKPGDWLSKYSAAVAGDFHTIWPYMRLAEDGKFVELLNPNLIHIGESLYHIPTFLSFRKKHDLPEVAVPKERVMSDAEKKKLTEEFVAREFGLKGDNLKALANALDLIGYADAGLTVIEVAGLVGQGSVLAGAATAAALAAPLAGMLGYIIGFINAVETGERLAGMRAIAYASVAWAFDDDKNDPQFPPFSRELERRMRSGFASESEINRCKRAWADAVRETRKELEKMALGRYGYARSKKSQKVLITAAKQRLILAGEGNRQKLCRFIMASFDREVTGQVLEIWKMTRAEYVYNE